MPHSSLKLGAAATALVLTACATVPTPYQPYVAEGVRGVHGGYSEQQLAPDRYRVRFHGNEYATRDRVEGYLLYRAAELTLKQGGDWFLLVDKQTEHEIERRGTPVAPYNPWFGRDYLNWHPDWRYYSHGVGWAYWHPWVGGPFWGDQVDWTTIESYEASADIEIHKGAMAASAGQAFDARKIMRDLGPTIEYPGTRKPR
jgi:hypothetical protein